MLWLLGAIALAKSPCAELKPKHRVSGDSLNAASKALQYGLSFAGVQIPAGAIPEFSTVRQSEDAKAYVLYETCKLKEAGLLSPEKAESMVAAIVVGAEPPNAAASRAALPTPTTSASLAPSPEVEAVMTASERLARSTVVAQFEPACRAGNQDAGTAFVCSAGRQHLAMFDAEMLKRHAPFTIDEQPPVPDLTPNEAYERGALLATAKQICGKPGTEPACRQVAAALTALDERIRAAHPPPAEPLSVP